MAKRTVLVVDRSTWGTPNPYPLIRRVDVEWVCPVCGGPRGEPYSFSFYDNGATHTCDRWNNACGHVDKYVDVLEEVKKG